MLYLFQTANNQAQTSSSTGEGGWTKTMKHHEVYDHQQQEEVNYTAEMSLVTAKVKVNPGFVLPLYAV